MAKKKEGTDQKDSVLFSSISCFQNLFPRNEECLKVCKVVAPVIAANGYDLATKAFQSIVGHEDSIASALPQFVSLTEAIQDGPPNDWFVKALLFVF